MHPIVVKGLDFSSSLGYLSKSFLPTVSNEQHEAVKACIVTAQKVL